MTDNDTHKKSNTGKERQYVACEDCQMDHLCQPIMVDGADINAIRNILKKRLPIERGEILFHKGDPFKSLYAVCAGSFKIITDTSSDNERVLGFHLIGELAGSYAIYSQQYPYTVQAMEASSVCEIPYEAMRRLGTHIPDIMNELTQLMSEEIQYTQSLLTLHTGKINAEERLASFLLGLSSRLEKHGCSPSKIKLSMTRSDIGSYLGLTKETISRLFSQLQEKNIITVSGKNVELLDMPTLQSLAGFQDSPLTHKPS